MILNEGGNVFADATPFDHKDVPAILKTVNTALQGTGITVIPVGSAATPKHGHQSGDMDVLADEAAVMNYFGAKDAKTARKALNDYIAGKGLATAQTGINVHVNVPVGQEHHQVDIMVTANAPQIAKFHTHNIPAGSPYKGVNKQMMMNSLASSQGLLWSPDEGLYKRDAAGKKAEFVSDDMNVIAQTLLGPNANADSLGSVESIMDAIPDEATRNAIFDKAKSFPLVKHSRILSFFEFFNTWLIVPTIWFFSIIWQGIQFLIQMIKQDLTIKYM